MEVHWLTHPKRVYSAGELIASIFWDNQGVIMNDYLEQGRRISGEFRRLRQEIARKRRGKLAPGVLLLQGNAPVHTSQVAVTDCGSEILTHPPIFSE